MAGCAVLAAALLGNAGHASAFDGDEALREVFRETSRAAGPEEKLKQLGAVRPTLGYQVALELCESALTDRAKDEDPEAQFGRAERIARTLRAEREGAALHKLITLYRGYDRAAAEQWLAAKTAVLQASALVNAGSLDHGLQLALSAVQIAGDLGINRLRDSR